VLLKALDVVRKDEQKESGRRKELFRCRKLFMDATLPTESDEGYRLDAQESRQGNIELFPLKAMPQ
jgi:hypothetical protein